ncbi:MAG TPA: pilin [Xanthomonadaceae bacterium]|nr:pilin [Xanthomonadaceae bacterium]
MKQIKNRNMQGFTLIELMIVVAIIAILAAIAISQYQDYVIRSQVSEGSSLADGVKTAVGEYVNNRGTYPSANGSAGLATNTSIVGTYVSQVDVAGGPVVVTYSNTAPQKANVAINTKTLTFSPTTTAGSITWACKSTTLKQKWCPSSCTCTG